MEIQGNNSIPSDREKKFDIEKLIEELSSSIKELIKLKLSIFEASRPMRENILLLAETKSHITFLKGIDVQEGKKYEFGELTAIDFIVSVDVLWVKEQVTKAEELIDELQEELDAFNYKTEISL